MLKLLVITLLLLLLLLSKRHHIVLVVVLNMFKKSDFFVYMPLNINKCTRILLFICHDSKININPFPFFYSIILLAFSKYASICKIASLTCNKQKNSDSDPIAPAKSLHQAKRNFCREEIALHICCH